MNHLEPDKSSNERGSMLIVALGILALLSIMAVTFVKLMNLERRATTNYVDMVKARLIAEGGLERSMAQLKLSISAETYSDPNAPWIYANGDYSLPLEESSGDPNAPGAVRSSFWGEMGASYASGKDSYRVKVLDTQTQFNLNSLFEPVDVPNEGEQDLSYIRFLDSLGIAIAKLNPRAGGGGTSGGAATGRNPIKHARYPKGSPNAARGGKAIYLFRQSRENGKFSSKAELLEVLESEDDYNLLKDYVTAHSWFDPKTVSARATDSRNKPWSDVIRREPRSPININLATTEVIAANLAGIGGRFFYVWTGDINRQTVDQGSTNYGFGGKNEETSYGSKGVVVYIDPFGLQPGQSAGDDSIIHGAIEFARQIKAHINNQGPFQSFSDWESFVDRTMTESFIDSTRNPDNNARVYPYWNEAKITDLSGNPLSGNPGVSAIRAEPQFRHAYHQAVRDMIKSNFNPNARLSSWNSDQVVRLMVDKGGLLYKNPDITDPTDMNKFLHMRQTLEWCLAPKGIFEVTTLGEVLGPPPADAKRQQDLNKDNIPDMEIFAQAKVRGILQLFNTESVRTQRDFEYKGDEYKDGNQREDCLSWPVAKIYWDPTAPGAIADVTAFYNDWVSTEGALFPGKDVGYLSLATRRKFGDIFHTQVLHMGLNAPDVPPKFEALFQDRRLEAAPANRTLENPVFADVLQADTSNGTSNNPNPGQVVAGRVANRHGWPYGDARRGIFPNARSSDVQEAWRYNVLTPDGYLNTLMRPSLLWYRASDSGKNLDGSVETFPAAGAGLPKEDRRGTSNIKIDAPGDPDASGNVSPTHVGAVEFWYKPNFDWNHRRWTGTQSRAVTSTAINQLYCGLLGTSHALINEEAYTHAGATDKGVYSRGTQMFMTRNTEGEIRITRLYYEVVGDKDSVFEVPYVEDPVNPGTKMKISDYYVKCSTDPLYTWPPASFYTNVPQEFMDIRWARSDYWLPANLFRNWRGGEWHHFAFRWEDRGNAQPGSGNRASLQVWIDGQGPFDPVSHQIGTPQGTPGYPGYIPIGSYDQQGNPLPPPPPAPAKLPPFVRLNGRSYNPTDLKAERPMDRIVVGAVDRGQLSKQSVVKDGVFKHTEDGKVELTANGTIDDVRFYDGATAISNPTIDYDGRYVDEGVWEGEIDLSPYFPADTGVLTLGSIDFTAYLPTAYGVVNGGHVDYEPGAGRVTVTFEVHDSQGQTKMTDPSWTATFSNNRPNGTSANGFPLMLNGNLIQVDRTDKLVYKVHMESAKFDPQVGLNNNAQGFNVATPVLDDISLIYFLPSSKVLLKERVNN
jgi:type II secretory pathway component PulK